MARGKIYTNRKKTLRVGEEKQKQTSKSKKDKKLAQQKRDKKPIATDVFDYRTGVVYSIRPEDTDVHALEAKVTSFLKEKGAIDDPKEFLTTAVYLGEPRSQTPPPTELDTPPSILPVAAKPKNPKMTSSEVPVTFWNEVKDVKSNNTYYWHPETNRTSWTLPENAVITSEASQRSDKITDPEDEEAPDLVKAYNHIAKTVYGVNDGTGEVKGNGIPSDSSIENKSKKDKIQCNTEEIPISEVLSPDPASKGTKSRTSTKTTAISKAESPMLKIQVSNLSDEISRKLEYLHVSRERVSELQRLQIQLETRLEDWKEEQLSSKFFLTKLKSASDQVDSFVQQEVPSGWTCVWDRASCRYYFSNASTGDVSWEFPIVNPDSVSSTHGAMEEEDSGPEQELNPPNIMNGSSVPVTPPGPPPAPVETSSSPTSTVPVVSVGNEVVTATNIKIEPSSDDNGEVSLPPTVNLVKEDEEITEVDMETEEKEDTPNGPEAEVDMAMAETPPMLLYEDVGPLTQQKQKLQSNDQQKQKLQNNEEAVDGRNKEEQQEEETSQPVVELVEQELPPSIKSTEKDEVVHSDDEKGATPRNDDEDDDNRYRYHKKSKRSRYHSDSDHSYDGHRKSSSKKSRKRHSSDDSDYSDSHRPSRRRSRSGERNYDRSDSEDRYHRKSSRSSKYSRDDSDDQYSSSRRSSHKQRSRSRSRDHGSRDPRKDKKKKKDKKKHHKHRDSSSGDEYYSSSRKSKSSKSKDRSYDFGGSGKTSSRESKEQNPPVDKKAFVPAKFKPKPKGRDDGDDSRLSATQLEMMQNIASVTGGGYMMATTYSHVVDPQYAAAYYTTAGYDTSGVPVVPAPAGTTQEQQQVASTPTCNVPVMADPTTAETITVVAMEQQLATVPTCTVSSNNTCSTTTTSSTGTVESNIPPTSDNEVTQPETTTKSDSPPLPPPPPPPPPGRQDDSPIEECEMELDDEGGTQGHTESSGVVEDPVTTTPPLPPAEQSQPPPSTSDTQSTNVFTSKEVLPIDKEVAAVTCSPSPVTTTTSAITTVDTPNIKVPTTSDASSIPGDITPPIQDVVGTPQSYSLAASSVATTYSNPPTSYSYDQTQQAAYAAAYSQQFYGSPYQYYTDPNQYAAAMNYYAAYQAAYNNTYSAYYQQGTAQNPATPGSNAGGNAQK